MIRNIDDLKVANAVVSAIAVPVVDVFALVELAAQMAFHDSTVLQNVDASSGDLNVAVQSDGSALSAIVNTATSQRAEPGGPPPEPARLDLVALSTNFAGAVNHRTTSVNVVICSIMADIGTAFKGF